jgi:uncharacterized RDD family membrane protein YckC
MAGNQRAGLAPGELELLDLDVDLLTGEAVRLDLRPASFASRALAIALDLVVYGLALIALMFVVLGTALYGDEAITSAAGLTTTVIGILVLPSTVETLTRGRSLGKLAAGLRVVRDDGGPIRFRQAFVRALVGVGELYALAGSIAVIASLSNRRGKRIGDMLAGTYVIRERTARVEPLMIGMPPELGRWAVAADIGRLPDTVALAVRQFLRRAPKLNPASRTRLGVGLADQIARYVAPPPPAGTDPERYLAAVMAERRRRDTDRLTREASARAARQQRRDAASPLSPLSTRLVGESPPTADR